MAPNPISMFIPKSTPRPAVTSPTSPQQRFSAEDRRRAMLDEQPEIYRNEGKFGPVPDIPVGTTWQNREECSKARMHTPTKAGISGGKDGAYSIVMSGGYPDDVDNGEFVIYTGTGGYGEENRYGGGSSGSWGSNLQIEDQSFDHKDNKSLWISCELGKPIRVIRGHGLKSKYAPYAGYRYDGIYKVTRAFMDKSTDGPFQVCRFELRREPGQSPIPTQWK